MASREPLFEDVCSVDFLHFKFGGRGYQDQLYDSIAKTDSLAGVRVEVVTVSPSFKAVWVQHNFSFLGGSLGCAEGEKITRAFEYGLQHKLPVIVQCKSGGARMQEGTSSLMQMAKVSVAVDALRRAKLPFISILNDPTYGGVSASYAMQGDVRISTQDARIGFAGPQVILNTMCEADQTKFDSTCPADFQSADYVFQFGQVDVVFPTVAGESKPASQTRLEEFAFKVAALLTTSTTVTASSLSALVSNADVNVPPPSTSFDYTRSRRIDRPQPQDIISTIFDSQSFVELSGDGCVGRDVCMRGGLATLAGKPCVVIGTFKGHTPTTMQESNYGMSSPHGYRTALRLMRLAERFGLPVITLVDTVGAWPTFECERDGQSEAIATNLTAMAGLTVPIVTLLVGEGGSGGALGIGMGNIIGMMSGGYFGVISPEGAASILGRYKDSAHKAKQFPLDCQELATVQHIYANQLKELGVVDEIIWEVDAENQSETYTNFPLLKARVLTFLIKALQQLEKLDDKALVEHRYKKYRAIGTFLSLDPSARTAAVTEAKQKKGPAKETASKPKPLESNLQQVLVHVSEETISGAYSRFKGKAPASCPLDPPVVPSLESATTAASLVGVAKRMILNAVQPGAEWTNAKHVLDKFGPEALAKWSRAQKKVLLTDTTMRDAHQSLLATRVRSQDILPGAHIAQQVLRDAFSLECWGGATFDVCMRFLDECPWDRLRALRKACPDICLQMLIRGANAVGYTSYADNVVSEFCRLAALNGMDIFRIFDCFNIVANMKVAIDAVRATGKVAEVCICYTGNVLTSPIYNLDYYKSVAKEIVAAGAHMIAIKDMAGLLRPLEAGPLLKAIREVIPSDMPVHFHTHSTSSAAISTCLTMAAEGCDIIDLCTASMADGTSQPSLNAFVACTEGASYDSGIDYMSLEVYDQYWSRVRAMYSPFESGMLSGSARVYDHQIPGGQYSNLLVQCASMGLASRWEEVLDAYRDVNYLLGDIVKVTPSSKCVGDMALYLVTRNLKTKDLSDAAVASGIDWPDSVVGLLKGELGLPHLGFPKEIEVMILKGQSKLTQRAGLVLPPVDFAANIKTLSQQFGFELSPEQAMSYLMYPKVFSDYIKRQQSKGGLLLGALPSPVYLYGASIGHVFNIKVSETQTTKIVLKRVGPLNKGARTLTWAVDGVEYGIDVKDKSEKFVFEGPMADTAKATEQIGSPMPGVVEKVLVSEGKAVNPGDVLMIISAMKMEVKVSAPVAGVVASICAPTGTRVVEGALLISLK